MISSSLLSSILLQRSHALSGCSTQSLSFLMSHGISHSSYMPAATKTVATQLGPDSAAIASLELVPSPAHLIKCFRTASFPMASSTATLAVSTSSCLAVAAAAQAQHRACQFLQGPVLPVLLAAQRQYASKAYPPAGSGSSRLPPPVLTRRLQDAKGLEQLLQLVQHHAPDFDHIHVSTAYIGAAKLRRNAVQPTQQPAAVQQLLSQLRQLATQLQQQCDVRGLANIMWACGRLGDNDTFTGLLPVFLQPRKLQQANTQSVSNVLLAAATLQLELAAEQLQLLLQRFMEMMPRANSQDVSNTVWAVATMQRQFPPQQLPQVMQHFVKLLPRAKPQAIANTLLACGKLQYAPLQLLSALEQHPEQLQAVLAAAIPQELANMAWACGQMGYKGRLLPEVLLQQAVTLQAGKTGSLNLQNICNLCWAAAVLDLQQCVPQVLQLAAAAGSLWGGSTGGEHLQQLYQVHLWLRDRQLPAPDQGLSSALSQQQLRQCKASWEQLLARTAQQPVTDLQRSVFAAVQQLPVGMWQKQPQLEQRTPDGAFRIDITATTAAGVQLAIEVDGPSHFIQPGNTLEGATQFRNRALAARGYVVVSIPYREWDALRGAEQKQQYLLAKLQPARKLVPSKHPQKQQQ